MSIEDNADKCLGKYVIVPHKSLRDKIIKAMVDFLQTQQDNSTVAEVLNEAYIVRGETIEQLKQEIQRLKELIWQAFLLDNSDLSLTRRNDRWRDFKQTNNIT